MSLADSYTKHQTDNTTGLIPCCTTLVTSTTQEQETQLSFATADDVKDVVKILFKQISQYFQKFSMYLL